MSGDDTKEKLFEGILNYIEKQQLLNIKGRNLQFNVIAESYKPT